MTVPHFTIPTVDISCYLADPSSPASRLAISQIRQACMTSGFFVITGHGIPRELQDQVFAASKHLFDLPLAEKEKLCGPSGRGYEVIGSQILEPGKKPDLKEGYYISAELAEDASPPYEEFCFPNIWPSPDLLTHQQFRSPMVAYHSRLCELSGKLMRMIAESLPNGDPHTFDAYCESPCALLRLLHYPPQRDLSDPSQLGAGAHTDFGGVTLLLQDGAGGLQVLNAQSGEWIDVPPDGNAYVVNVGDMLEAWTKGMYRSNVHRVVNASGGDRYSVPFFFDGNLDVVVGEDGRTVKQFLQERYLRTYVAKSD